MSRFAAGFLRFHKQVFPQKRDLFEKLSHGQSPEALFITCSDSRIDPAMITQTDPGELFVCRNAGNVVPPHSKRAEGMNASIEFAVIGLKVPHIVVCGHTQCGAMKGALNPGDLTELPLVSEWLDHVKAAVDVVEGTGGGKSEADRMRLLLEQNVILQLQHLRTHPSVAAALAKGAVQLHGWIYDIKSGDVEAWDDSRGAFLPFEQRYAEALSAARGKDAAGITGVSAGVSQ